jgi:hypothetical protein
MAGKRVRSSLRRRGARTVPGRRLITEDTPSATQRTSNNWERVNPTLPDEGRQAFEEVMARAPMSHGDAGGMDTLFGDKKIMILSFYKGTHFPCTPILTYGDWTHNKGVYEKYILDSLQKGINIRETITTQTDLLNKMEKYMLDWGKKHPSGLIKGKEIQKDLVEFMGKEYFGKIWEEKDMVEKFHLLQNVWYMAVYVLIRTGQIKDDDKNGWCIMDENAGEWMKSM